MASPHYLQQSPRRFEETRSTTLLAAVHRYRLVVAVLTLVGGLAGSGVSLLRSPSYPASTDLLLQDAGSAVVFGETLWDASDPTRYVRNQASRLTAGDVLEAAARRVGERSGRELADRVTAVPSEDGDLISLTAVAATPAAAERLADAVVSSYERIVAQERREMAGRAARELRQAADVAQAHLEKAEDQLVLEPGSSTLLAEREAASARVAALQGRAEQIEVDAALFGAGLQTAQPAVAKLSPIGGSPLRNGLIAAILGLLGAAAAAWARAAADPVIERASDAALVLGAPPLGDLPAPRRGRAGAGLAARNEAFRGVAALLDLAAGRTGGNTLVLTSADGRGDSSAVALGAAAALGASGRRAVLIDADVRARRVSAWAGLDVAPGLTDPLDSDQTLADRLIEGQRLPGSVAGWAVLPAGSGLVGTPRACSRLRDLAGQADVVLLNAPPLGFAADAVAAAEQADGVVLVIRRGTPLRLLEEAHGRLAATNVPLLGFVLVRGRLRRHLRLRRKPSPGAALTSGSGSRPSARAAA